MLTLAACSSDERAPQPAPSNDAGAAGEAGSGEGGASGEAGAANGAAGEGGAAGTVELPDLAAVIEQGAASVVQAPRPAFGALLAVQSGQRSYVVESRRDVAPGPYGFPWRTSFRLAAYDAGELAWSFDADQDDAIGDVVVHPSGEVTLALLPFPPASDAFELVRMTAAGKVISSSKLPRPTTAPETDYAATDPRPLFRMQSPIADATSAGYVRLLADGEDLVAAFLSWVDVPATSPLRTRYALGVEALAWQRKAFVESWARVVDGPHGADPTAWAYDEFRWREQAVRPFLARDESTGDLLIGRAWNSTRCAANVATFAEFDNADCIFGAVDPMENERLPLAITRFDSSGERLGTRILVPDEDAAEQVPFALAARAGQLAVVGSLVRKLESGKKRTYPDANGAVDYDGYVAIYDGEGALLTQHDFNLGRGDVLAALRWTEHGVLAVGSTGWDRWQGGMSVLRGADPLFAWLARDGKQAVTRVLPLSDGSRHFTLHDVTEESGVVTGYGFADGPMTHSADNGNTAGKTFGPLTIRLQ